MFQNFRPLNDRVLLKRVKSEDTTEGGIIIPEAAQEKAQTGEVISVGAGKRDTNGQLIMPAVKAGDVVYFSKYAGTEAGEDHLIIREDEILGVVER